MVDMVRQNKGSELQFLAYKNLYNKVKTHIDLFIELIENTWEKVKHIENEEEFILKVKDMKISYFLLELKAKKITSIRETLRELPLDRLVEYLVDGDLID
jgi:hypothetical protein